MAGILQCIRVSISWTGEIQALKGLPVGFILTLLVLSVTVSPDQSDQQQAINSLRGLPVPVLLQPLFNFTDDQAGPVTFKNLNVFTRPLYRMKTVQMKRHGWALQHFWKRLR